MVDDIILTPEEQAEQTKEWLKKNIPSIFIGLALGIAVVYGYTNYANSKTNEALNASALFQEIVSADNSSQLAGEKIDQFKSDFASTPYAAKVALMHAKGLAEKGDLTAALNELQWAEKNTGEELISNLAKLRQAEIYINEEKYDDANKIIATTAPKGFESIYLELKGDIAAAREDYATALNLYSEALDSDFVDRGYITFLQLKINRMNSLSKSKS